MVYWFLTLGILSTVVAVPSIVFPVNLQVPPVARVSKAFHFVFAQSTFSSNAANINYALSGAPGWLQLDSASRSLFGTPGLQDAGPVIFNLVASDDTGSSAMAVTLIVSTEQGPTLERPAADQLPAFGAFSSPESLILPYSSQIALSFSPNTFANTNKNTVYYALCANNTPLPSWINFDSNSLSFSGTTPQSTSPAEISQTYDIHFTASDVVGFAGAIASFQLVVENHIFTFDHESKRIDVTPGLFVNYSGLQTSLTMDDCPIQPKDLSQIEAETPPWMSLDTNTLVLSGTPPNDVSPLNFTVSATDKYGDQANTVVCVVTSSNASTSFFSNQLSPVNATVGSMFAYSLADALDRDPKVQVTVDLSDAPWLSFDPGTKVLQGKVPSSLRLGQVLVNVTASEETQSQSETLIVDIIQAGSGVVGRTTSGPSATTRTGSTTATGGTYAATPSLSANDRREKGWIAAVVVLPLFAALAFFVLLCWSRRRRRASKQGYIKPSKEQISRPQPLLWVRRASVLLPLNTAQKRKTPEHGTIAEKSVNRPKDARRESGMGTISSDQKTSSKAPKIGFLRLSQPRWSGLGVPQETMAATVHPEPKPVYQLAPEDQEKLSQGAKTASRKRRSSRLSDQISIFDDPPWKRCSAKRKHPSITSMSSSAAPFGRRMSGFGHGRNGLSSSSLARGRSVVGLGHGNGGPPGHGMIRHSWRSEWLSTTGSSSSKYLGSERSQTLTSNLHWPRPPTSTTLNPVSQPQTIKEASDDDGGHRPTIRRVLSVSEDPWPARQTYVERRARNRHRDNALFAAKTSSRATSQLLLSNPLRTSALPLCHSNRSLQNRQSANPETNKENADPSRSRSSSLSSSLKPTPLRLHRSNLLTSAIRVLSPQRSRSRFRSNASLRSSRFGDAENSPSSPDMDLREEIDEYGQKRWRNVESPNPLGSNSVGDDGRETPSPAHPADSGIEALFNAAEGSKAVRLSKLGEATERREGVQSRGDESGGVQRRAVLGSQKAKRPVSVPNVFALRPVGESFRGEVGAFI